MLRQLRPIVLYPALALGSFFAVAHGVRSIVPWPEGLGLRSKMEFFEEHRDDYDAVIIGSSRSFRGLDPRIIDAEFARAGHPLRTFNLALGGMRAFEQDYLLHRVLEMEPARLRWIFFEGGPVGMGLREDHIFREPVNLASARGVQWHTPDATAKVLGSLWGLPLPLTEKLDHTLTHVELLGWRMANYGKGEDVLKYWRWREETRPRREATWARMLEGQGHMGLEQDSGREMSDEILAFLEDPAPFDERMAAIEPENRMGIVLDELNLDVYRAQLRAAERLGCRLIYYTPPGYEGTPERLRLHEAGILPALVHLNDPERYPELFQLDHRYDKGHMNRRGAERLSLHFARGMLEYLEQAASTPETGD